MWLFCCSENIWNLAVYVMIMQTWELKKMELMFLKP